MLNEAVDIDGEKLSVWLRGVISDMPQQQLFDASLKNPHTAFVYVPSKITHN